MFALTIGCRDLLGIDDGLGIIDDQDANGDDRDASGDKREREDATGATDSSTAKTDAQPTEAGPAPVCPSKDAACAPELVLTGLFSPGELKAMGTRLAFREHAKSDGPSVSSIRLFDPAGSCTKGSCLPLVATGPDNYRNLIASKKHLCHTSEYGADDAFVRCVSATTLLEERLIQQEGWLNDGAFLDDDRFIYGTWLGDSTYGVRTLDLLNDDPPFTVIGPVGGSTALVASSTLASGDSFFAWAEQGAYDTLFSRDLHSPTPNAFLPMSKVVSVATSGDVMLWATPGEIRSARYTAGGYGTPLPMNGFVTCPGSTKPAIKALVGARGAAIALVGCSIPGSLASALVYVPLDGSASSLLASKPSALTSATALGDYVYYAIGRNTAADVATDEIWRVRIR